MLQGSLDSRGLPRIGVWLRGPFGSETVSAVVDTGFTGALSLPAHLVRRLGLPRRSLRPTVLAAGTLRVVHTYLLDVIWFDAPVPVEVYLTDGPDATVGAGLLRGHVLTIDYGTAETVEIR